MRTMGIRVSLAVAAVCCWPASLAATDTTLIPTGANWRYLDDGSDQGTAWTGQGFDAGAWSQGPAQLGYGDGDEATVVSFGSNSSNKYTTTYFRHQFSVADPSVFQRLDLRVLRDDGVVVYLNGVEVYRSNMPAGPVNSATFASSAVGGTGESTFQSTTVDPSLLVTGTNVVAVEIHQANLTSSDISFDLDLVGSDIAVGLVRGPYLQMADANGVTVRWRTDSPTSSRVAYGPDPDQLDSSVEDAALVTEHEVPVTGLQLDTRYYYGIGTLDATLAGGDTDHHFTTSPAAGSAVQTRIWVIGDSGTASANAAAVYSAYQGFAGSADTDLWLMLGDNAYPDGTDGQYQAAVFDMYPELLRNTTLWSTLGNHDGHSADSASETGPYYDIFTFPRTGEIGGMPSGTEAYYSFDYGNIHFICLDSYETDRSPSGAMMTWLEDDLMLASADWVIAFWHHPPYSKGSHDSDSEGRLIDMRQNALPLLEAYGVDLVLTGHSHSYERSFLVDGHYGTSGTLQPHMILDGGAGRESGDGAYTKPELAPTPNDGAVYVVAGSSGQVSGGSLDHPVMFLSVSSLGSLVLDVDGGRLDATFLDQLETVVDTFTMVKGSSPPACDNDGICETGEDCSNCPDDCGSGGGGGCGNGICEPSLGEDCLSCASDCRGKQNGNPSKRFCCGDGDGENPVACGDVRCSENEFECSDSAGGSFCCGDGTCDLGESSCSCGIDCGLPPVSEAGACDDGVDNDCDGAIDCLDFDCVADPICSAPPGCDGDGVCEPGEDCNNCATDCDGRNNGKPANRFCCGDGTAQSAEGNGNVCDGNF